jgi:glutathione S-transferase
MKLLYQTHSPYARKVLVAAHEMGLQQRLCVVHHETSPTRRNEEVFALNPLGKVPVLICDDGAVLFDSNVICEYLDGLHANAPLIPAEPRLRWHALKMQALAQGMADAGIAARWEAARRPAQLRWPAMHDGQIQKIAQACDLLEREIGGRGWPEFRADVGPGVAPDGDADSRARVRTGMGLNVRARVGAGVGPGRPSSAPGIGGTAPGIGGTAPGIGGTAPDLGDIAVATALSWLDFRGVYAFLPGRPRLAAWYRALCSRPSMLATALAGETQD